jgi:hypothetical protein
MIILSVCCNIHLAPLTCLTPYWWPVSRPHNQLHHSSIQKPILILTTRVILQNDWWNLTFSIKTNTLHLISSILCESNSLVPSIRMQLTLHANDKEQWTVSEMASWKWAVASYVIKIKRYRIYSHNTAHINESSEHVGAEKMILFM